MRPEEAELLRLMMIEGVAMVEFVMSRMSIDEFTEGPVRAAVAALIAQYESGEVDPDAFLRGEFGEEIQRLVAEVMADRYSVSERGASRRGVPAERRDARPRAAAGSAMRLLKLDRIEEALAEVQREIYLAEQSGTDASDLYHRVTALTDLRGRVERGSFVEWNAS
jgi:DNA primase